MIYFDGAGRYCPQWWGRHDRGYVRWLLTLRLQWWGRHGSGHEVAVHAGSITKKWNMASVLLTSPCFGSC